MEERSGIRNERYEQVRQFRTRIVELIENYLNSGRTTFWTVEVLRDAGCIDSADFDRWLAGQLQTLDEAFRVNFNDLRRLIFMVRDRIKKLPCHSMSYRRVSPVSREPLVISAKEGIASLLSDGFFIVKKPGDKGEPAKKAVGRYMHSKVKQRKLKLAEYLDRADEQAGIREARKATSAGAGTSMSKEETDGAYA